jgi:hypothetical protein
MTEETTTKPETTPTPMATESQASEPKKKGRPKKADPVKPKIRMRNAVSKDHHLFKAEVADTLKNTSWTRGNPKIVKIEHCHFFHTIDSNLREQKYTTPVNNHYHKVSWFIDSDGELRAECGPPIRKVTKTRRDGSTRTVEEPITFENDHTEENGLEDTIIDDHRHDMTYIGTDRISPKIVKAMQEKTVAAIATAMGGD